MQTTHPQQPTFVGGEVSPRLLARSDVEKFVTSAFRLENFVVRPQGPVSRRRGTALRNSFGVYPDDVLFSFLPRRDQGVVLALGDGRVGIPSIGTDDYEEPATAPVVMSRSGTSSLGMIGFNLAGTYYLVESVDQTRTIADGSENRWSGQNRYDRGSRSRVSETYIEPYRSTCLVTDDEGETSGYAEPISDDFMDPAPSTHIPGYPTDVGTCEVGARDPAALAFSSVVTGTDFVEYLDGGLNVVFRLDYSEEYTVSLLCEDAIATAFPSGAFAAALPVAETNSTFSGGPPPAEATRAEYYFTWNIAELKPGLPYFVRWSEVHTPPFGPDVVTDRVHSFVFDGTTDRSPVYVIDPPSGGGSTTITAPYWD